MEWARLVVDALRGLAWPITVIVIVLLFHRQIRDRVASLREAEFPGGLKLRLDALQRDVETTPDVTRHLASDGPWGPGEAGHPSLGRSALALTRLDLELEIFRFAQLRAPSEELRVDRADPLVALLVEHARLNEAVANQLRDYLRISDELLRLAEPNDDELTRAVRIGETLLAYVRRAHSVERLVYEMASHGVWHQHGDADNTRYLWAAIASETSVFHYDYDVLVEAFGRFDQRTSHPVPPPTLREYVEILEFRMQELSRVVADRSHRSPEEKEWFDWQWPQSWGYIGWKGPVSGHSEWSREEELFLTTRAVKRYHTRLSATDGAASG